MTLQVESIFRRNPKNDITKEPQAYFPEKHRMIVNLARMFSRRYDLEVLPSHQKGLWACTLDPKYSPQIEEYVSGEKENLDDLPPEAFNVKQILYDEQSAQKIPMEETIAILRHEAGHVQFSDFRSLIEGQRNTKKEGHLPTSFWWIYEGLEDPRVNNLEGEESFAIEAQIKRSHVNSIQERLQEQPISKRPLMVQFAYNSLYYWLHDKQIPELEGTEVGKTFTEAQPFIDSYFRNTDVEERKILIKKVWDIAKTLERKNIEDEKAKQMLKKKGKKQSKNQSGDGQMTDPEFSGKKGDDNDLSEEESREIKETIEKLSPQEREELEEKAREVVDNEQAKELEKEIQKTFKLKKDNATGEYEIIPQIADERTISRAEEELKKALKKIEEEEKKQAERDTKAGNKPSRDQERQAKLLEKRRMEEAGFTERERKQFLLYQDLEDSIRPHVKSFIELIDKIMPRKNEPTYENGYFTGPRFDRRDLVRKAPLGDEQFFMRQIERPTGEPARLFIGLLTDNSSSMSGINIENARKINIFFAKVCKDLGIPFMAVSFGARAHVIKKFDQNFDSPTEKIKPRLLDATKANEGSTNIHEGIEIILTDMNEFRKKLRESHGLIFVISDGGANAGITGLELQNYIEEKKGKLTFKGFGLGGKGILDYYFGAANCTYPDGIEDLPNKAYLVLRATLIQFQRYLA